MVNKTDTFFVNLFFDKILDRYTFKKITLLLTNMFNFGYNAIFLDINTNYNYLPIDNSLLFNRSFSSLKKLLTYFNVGLVFYINLKKKKFILKKLIKCNFINISLSSELVQSKFDLIISVKNDIKA